MSILAIEGAFRFFSRLADRERRALWRGLSDKDFSIFCIAFRKRGLSEPDSTSRDKPSVRGLLSEERLPLVLPVGDVIWLSLIEGLAPSDEGELSFDDLALVDGTHRVLFLLS